jgi:hypothetical protein
MNIRISQKYQNAKTSQKYKHIPKLEGWYENIQYGDHDSYIQLTSKYLINTSLTKVH